jgi:hypothetical protein
VPAGTPHDARERVAVDFYEPARAKRRNGEQNPKRASGLKHARRRTCG